LLIMSKKIIFTINFKIKKNKFKSSKIIDLLVLRARILYIN